MNGEGRFAFRTIKPSSYPVPVDGGRPHPRPVGPPPHAARTTFISSFPAPGYSRLALDTSLRQGDSYLGSDAVFGVKKSLIASDLCAERIRGGSEEACVKGPSTPRATTSSCNLPTRGNSRRTRGERCVKA